MAGKVGTPGPFLACWRPVCRSHSATSSSQHRMDLPRSGLFHRLWRGAAAYAARGRPRPCRPPPGEWPSPPRQLVVNCTASESTRDDPRDKHAHGPHGDFPLGSPTVRERKAEEAGPLVSPGVMFPLSNSCSNLVVWVQRPDLWPYPAQCRQGHRWRPDRVIVSWLRCQCAPALVAAGGHGPAGHPAVNNRAPGCRSAWYRPPHEPVTHGPDGSRRPDGPRDAASAPEERNSRS